MFFPLSKVIFFVLTPSNFLIFVGWLGLVLLVATRWRRTGAGLAGFGLGGLALAGLSPLPFLALAPLEQRFPAFAEDGAPPTGIIVLGGGVDSGLSEARRQIVVNDAGERPIYLADLARRFPSARLVFSGGSGSLSQGLSEAEIVGRMGDVLGAPRSRLILEHRSRNTRENALFTADLVKPKPGERWLLVTSAWHMPRSIGCFRQAGFEVTAFPVDYRTRGFADAFRFNSFASDGLLHLDLAVKEWIGLLAYRLAGYTSDAFPAPSPELVPEAAPEASPGAAASR
ncbi:YdcF family protein [Methylobacterium durans]|uniref:YdcF family protein n=1 Tax=Methylobacterium durans TaxID=2202825 RepID=A0A2U8W7Y0_9HYPH|nr:YdcF family protein [Methylobacterium durans]AWN42227.1 YdcF family protein [Methylobacterium durans]